MEPSKRWNRRHLMPAAALLAGVAMLALASNPVGAASSKEAKAGPSPVGSWHFTVSQSDGQAQAALLTFGADGTLIASGPPVSSDGGGLTYNSAGHGAWQSDGSDGFAFTFEELQSNPQGRLASDITVDATGTLDASGATMSGQFVVTIAGPDGTVYGQMPGTFSGTAISVEPMPSPDTAMNAAGSPAPSGSPTAG